MREIVCICFGNICRSPMMEALLQQALDAAAGPGEYLVTGAGIGADDGRPPSQGTVRSMSGRGLDVRKHRSRHLTPTIAREAWRIYAAETYQVEHAQRLLPAEQQHKVRLMGGEEIPDPIGSGQIIYDRVAEQVERLIPGTVAEILADAERE
jgi:protein-tyrosine phosphatase